CIALAHHAQSTSVIPVRTLRDGPSPEQLLGDQPRVDLAGGQAPAELADLLLADPRLRHLGRAKCDERLDLLPEPLGPVLRQAVPLLEPGAVTPHGVDELGG